MIFLFFDTFLIQLNFILHCRMIYAGGCWYEEEIVCRMYDFDNGEYTVVKPYEISNLEELNEERNHYMD